MDCLIGEVSWWTGSRQEETLPCWETYFDSSLPAHKQQSLRFSCQHRFISGPWWVIIILKAPPWLITAISSTGWRRNQRIAIRLGLTSFYGIFVKNHGHWKSAGVTIPPSIPPAVVFESNGLKVAVGQSTPAAIVEGQSWMFFPQLTHLIQYISEMAHTSAAESGGIARRKQITVFFHLLRVGMQLISFSGQGCCFRPIFWIHFLNCIHDCCGNISVSRTQLVIVLLIHSQRSLYGSYAIFTVLRSTKWCTWSPISHLKVCLWVLALRSYPKPMPISAVITSWSNVEVVKCIQTCIKTVIHN